jgi:hypothetical protein
MSEQVLGGHFIDDAQDREVTIPAKSGRYPALTIRFRPAMPEENLRLLRMRDPDGNGFPKFAVEIIDKYLLSWSAKDKDGKDVPKTPATIARMNADLQLALIDIIMGYVNGPEDVAAQKNS